MTGPWLASYIALWILFLALAAALVAVLHNLGVLYDAVDRAGMPGKRSSNLDAGQVLPEVTWRTLAGNPVKSSALKGTRQAIVIVSPTCAPCVEHVKEIAAGERDLDPLDATLQRHVVVCLSDADTAAGFLERVGIDGDVQVLFDRDHELTRRWGISATPTTVIVDDELRVVRQIYGAEAEPTAHNGAHAVTSGVHSTNHGGTG
jgi:hypothetical protein